MSRLLKERSRSERRKKFHSLWIRLQKGCKTGSVVSAESVPIHFEMLPFLWQNM